MRGRLAGGVVGIVLLGVIAGTAPAAAAPGAKAGTWATLTPTSAALAPGFPDAVITSTGGVGVATTETVTGATPPGLVYGTSNGRSHLSIATSTSTPVNAVTITFASPTPASGWSVVLGDVDAENLGITGVTAGGTPVSAADLGTVETYAAATGAAPAWDPALLTVVGEGVDTDGASAWFSPTVSLTSLTFTANRVIGSPAAYVWLVGLTASLAGTVTDGTGAPVPGATVQLQAPGGAALPGATPILTGADGSFEFPAVIPAPLELVATAPGGVPGAPVGVTPTDGAFPAPIPLVAEPVVLEPAAPELPPTGAEPLPLLLAASVLLVAGLLVRSRTRGGRRAVGVRLG